MLRSILNVVRIVVSSSVIAAALLYLFPTIFSVRPLY